VNQGTRERSACRTGSLSVPDDVDVSLLCHRGYRCGIGRAAVQQM